MILEMIMLSSSPDLNVAKEDEIMVSKYLEMGSLDSENPIEVENGMSLHSGNDDDVPSKHGKIEFKDSENLANAENGKLPLFGGAVPGTAICADKVEEHRDESPLSKDIIRHCYFSLHVALYAYKSQMLQALVLKLWLAFNYLYQLILNMFLSRLVEKMKRDVDVGLIADFRRFHREKATVSRGMPTLDATASSRDQSL